VSVCVQRLVTVLGAGYKLSYLVTYISQKPHVQDSPNVMSVLLMAVARSS